MIFKVVHRLCPLHRDMEPRNIRDTNNGNLMAVDFERVELCSRQPLSLIGESEEKA